MNAKKAKQLRKVARSFELVEKSKYEVDKKGNFVLNKLCAKSLNKELKKSFK